VRRLAQALGIAALVLVPSSLFLGRYMIEGTGIAPVGSDTPQVVWRSEVVARLGLDALPSYQGKTHALNTNADRPGLPVVLAAFSAFTGAEARDLVYVLPAVVAAAIASAAAALAGAIPRVPWWGIVLAGLVTGASVQVVLAANGYLDQLMGEALLVAAAAGALRAADGGRGRVLSAGCLVAAFLVHWQFAALFAGLLGLLAAACLPESLARRGKGVPFLDTPTGRLGIVVGAGLGIGIAAVLAGAPGGPRPPIGLGRGISADRGQARLYRLPATGAAAALGAASLLVPRGEPGRRRAAWLLVAWALLPAVAALLYAAGRTVPVQRTLSFALAIPLLGALGAAAAIGWLRDRGGRLVVAAAVVLTGAALLASLAAGWDVWRSRRPWSDDRRLAELQAVATYLTDADRPAVIVVDTIPRGGRRGHGGFGTVPVLRRVRAELPPRLALRTTVYLGDPDLLLAGRPTLRPAVPGFDEISRDTWQVVRTLRSQDPVIVIVRSRFDGFRDAVRDHPEWMTTPWMAVVSGPPPSARAVVPERPFGSALVAWWATSLVVIALAGAGWAGRFADGAVAVRIALAPAVGLAAITLVGILVERLGVRMGGLGGVVTVTIVALGGAAAAAGGRFSRRPALQETEPTGVS
jgi:hypothetical protein